MSTQATDLLSLNTFILFGGFLGIVMGAARPLRGIEARNLLLAGFLSCVGFLQVVSAIFHSGQIDRHPVLFLSMIPLVLLAGPLLYGLYRSLFDETFAFDPRNVLHAAPALFIGLYLAWTFRDLNALVPLIRLHQETGELDEFRMFLVGGVGLVLVYLTTCIFRIALFWNRTNADSKRSGTVLAGIYFLFALTALIGLLLDVRVLVRAINAGTTLLFLALYFLEQKYPDMVERFVAAVKKRREQSHLKSVDLTAVKKRLLDLMEKEKPFCDEDITLPGLAALVGISPHQLSEFLNEHMARNFNRFINEFRVKEAQNLLITQPSRSILSVGMAVGFNSTSAFHQSFRTYTGLTPARFRKTASTKHTNS